jgi:uracil-DNA glycosylase
MERIVFVGDKPSAKNLDPNVPFVGTQSYKKLLDWIFKMNLDVSLVFMCNKDGLKPYHTGLHKFVALGNEAEKALKNHVNHYWDISRQAEYPEPARYFKLPHPSGRNPKANASPELDQLLKECETWLKQS